MYKVERVIEVTCSNVLGSQLGIITMVEVAFGGH